MADRYTYRETRLTCPACGPTTRLLWTHQPVPACGCGQQLTERQTANGAHSVIQDSIEGGVDIYHGLCNSDGTPRRYYSRSEIAAEAAKRGMQQIVEHKVNPRTGKSLHTINFAAYPPPDFNKSPEQRKRDMAAFLGMTYERYIEQFG